MPTAYDGTDWRYGIRHARLFVMVWSTQARHHALQRQKLAYAMQCGRPIRLLCREGARLPEDLCLGYADVQTARVETAEEAQRQVMTWLAELPTVEGETR